jgi:serine/threonine-protein kinase
MGLRLVQSDRARARSNSGTFGRYSLHDTIASGEVTSVHVGLLEGASGFKKPVAFKRLLPRFIYDRAEIARLSYEACVLAQIHHPSVIQVLDLVEASGESYLVMEYVLGESLAGLTRSGSRAPIPVAVAMIAGALRGLDAAHSARGAAGQPLSIVHRNVCPENVLVGADGVTRIVDFGAALSMTGSRSLLRDAAPNLDYAAPEQLMQRPVDLRADIFSMGVVLWETLTGKRLFRNPGARDAFLNGQNRNIMPAAAFNAEVPRSLDEVVFRALSWQPEERFESAADFACELELAVSPANPSEVSAFVEKKGAVTLKAQRALLSAIDAPSGRISEPPPGEDTYDDATIRFSPDQVLLHLSTQKGQNVVPSPVDVLRRRLTSALDSSVLHPGIGTMVTRVVAPLRGVRAAGSTMITGVAAALLLLAGVMMSRGTPPPATAAIALPPAPTAEARRPSEDPGRNAHRIAVAAMDLAPSDTGAQLDEARTAPEQHAPEQLEARAERARPRARPQAKRITADRGSCDPPFTLDSAGIKRLKLNCL